MDTAHRRIALPLVLATAALSLACVRGGSHVSERPGVSLDRGAFVLSGSALQDGRGTVLDAMRGKIPNFRVRSTSERCPAIALRTSVANRAASGPNIYVDGTRSTDSCILQSLSSSDVERIEVYPMGFTTRPGYGRSSQGLILLFMRAREQAP